MNASDKRSTQSSSGFAAKAARWSDAHPSLLFTILSGWYVALVWRYNLRPMWFDELSTFYIAQQPTVARMMEAIRTIDLNPPLNYFLTRWSIGVFGAHACAARLPGLVAYWVGSLAIYALLRRWTSTLIAVTGVLLFWSNPFFQYASEARPYGLLLGLTVVLLWAWNEATEGNRKIGIASIFFAATLLLLSHIFGALSLGAVWVGEAVRSWRRRRVDWQVVGVLLLPLIATVTYWPMFHRIGNIVFPPDSQITWGKLYFLYFATFRWMWRPLVAIGITAALWRTRDRAETSKQEDGMTVALALLFLIPVGLTILFLRSHGAFYDRYAMVVVVPVVLVAPWLLWGWTNGSPRAAMTATVSVAVLLLLSTTMRPAVVKAASFLPERAAKKTVSIFATSEHGPFRPWWKKLDVPAELLTERERAPLLKSLDDFDPTLPIVPGNELTFLEMDNRESPEFTRRLVYVYDRAAEMQITQRSSSSGMLAVRRFFPIRGSVVPYASFVRQHREFLVVALWEHSGDWLLRKLVMDGARLEIVGQYEGYTDTDVYRVNMPSERNEK